MIERNIHRTNLQRLAHFFALITPIAAAFGGYFLATPLWKLFKTTPVSEDFKFILSLVSFTLLSGIIYILTRRYNPIINIAITKK